jgi:hypothetical protein
MSKFVIPDMAADRIKNDFAQAHADVETVCGQGASEARPELVGLFLVWRSLDRLAETMRRSARADDWMASQAATVAKGCALGIEARPGEGLPDYRARLAAAMKERGPA